MHSELFLKTRRDTWERLNRILEQISLQGLASLQEDDLRILGTLFRRASADLAYARTNYPGHEMTEYLNNLVMRAHGIIYRSESFGLRPITNFFTREFPCLVIQQRHLIFLAGMILLLGMAGGYFLHFFQPSLDGWVIPNSIKKAVSDSLGRGHVGAHWALSYRPAISAMIMVNNIKVGAFAFALGFTWGLGTVIVLFNNGLMVGVLGAIFTAKGFSWEFWSLILPHGVLEFLAIFICGGAGLAMAKAVVKPGDYSRRNALLVQGRIAVKLVVGSIPLFIVAALIEGFITPSGMTISGKLGVAACSLIAFMIYIYFGNQQVD